MNKDEINAWIVQSSIGKCYLMDLPDQLDCGCYLVILYCHYIAGIEDACLSHRTCLGNDEATYTNCFSMASKLCDTET